MQKVALVNSTTDDQKKPMLRETTDRAWFSRLLRHPARKRSGFILTTPEPALGASKICMNSMQLFYNIHKYCNSNSNESHKCYQDVV